jgi:enoyl-CoA hydratase
MQFENIIFEQVPPLAILTINRPEVRNALNQKSWQEIQEVLDEVSRNDELKVLIITGAGEKAFIAGSDIKALRERTMVETLDNQLQALLRNIEALKKPVIAAINGYALGGGCEVALACDIRVASEKAKFGQPEINLGIMPGAGGTQRLARLVGPGVAKELIFMGRIIDAEEAYRIGLVNKVVPHGQLMDTVKDMATTIAKKSPLTLSLAKLVVNTSFDTDITTGLAIERLGQTIIFGSSDRKEGIDAFLEKREPNFKGE